VAVDAIKADKTLSELAKAYDVHPNQIVDWKNQMLERASSVFGAESAAPPAARPARGLQHRPWQPVHERGVHRCAQEPGHRDQHGRQGRLAR
jgi:transposase-like protein